MTATILITRPEPGASRLAEALARLLPDHRALVAPLMAITSLAPRPPRLPMAGVIFTSAAAVGPLTAIWDQRPPAYCVGAQTARAARAAGFPLARVAEDARALVAALAESRAPQGPVLQARGQHVAADLPGDLAPLGWQIQPLVVYDQIPCPLPAPLAACLAAPGRVIAPLYSPRAAQILAETAGPQALARLEVVAISPAVAAAAQALAPRALRLAAQPDGPAMLAAIIAQARAENRPLP